MDGVSFIPLGGPSVVTPSDISKGMIGKTAEERKQIAREHRLEAKKEKKKSKSEAKKQRKLNAVLHRRMTRNNEKYDKNKERNKDRAIFLERWAIWNGAIHQAERLAAKYDPTGKLFNVGEVVIMPDGAIKSIESLRKAKEKKEQRDKEKAEFDAAKTAAAEMKQAIQEGKLPPQYNDPVEGVNPQRQALMEGVAGIIPKVPHKLSNKQKQRLEMFAPRPEPPKPIIPEGFKYPPTDEEDFLSMWNITDEEIQRRIVKHKQKKVSERKNLRRRQKEQQKINKQLKIRKKQAANLGILFDREKALKEIIGNQSGTNTSSEDESDSNSDSDESLEFDSDGGEITKDEKKTKKPKMSEPKPAIPHPKSSKEQKLWVNKPQPPATQAVEKKSKKRSSLGIVEDVPKSKNSEEITAESGAIEASITAVKEQRNKETHVPVPSTEAARAALKEANRNAKKEKKKLEKEKKRQEELARANEELAKNNLATTIGEAKEHSKKRKRSKNEEIKSTENGNVESVNKKKKHKKHKNENDKSTEEPTTNENDTISNSAQQWNPEALTGDEARKAKFLRLLGAGKSKNDTSSNQQRSGTNAAQISQVQEDLERQYEAGMKHKGSKRKGLGA